jgi:TRAP-type C4-dicarboxylate transport system substrate-binding protein
MGLFDEVEKLTGDAAGQGAEDSLVQKAVQEGEQLLEEKTGGKFDAEIQQGGDLLEQQLDQHLPKL